MRLVQSSWWQGSTQLYFMDSGFALAQVAAPASAEFLAAVERKGELLRAGLRQALAGNPHVKVGTVLREAT